jgi:hypothetical protein
MAARPDPGVRGSRSAMSDLGREPLTRRGLFGSRKESTLYGKGVLQQ